MLELEPGAEQKSLQLPFLRGLIRQEWVSALTGASFAIDLSIPSPLIR